MKYELQYELHIKHISL